MPNNLLRQPNFAALVVLVWLLVALGLLLQFWTQTAETLLDTDDAMRLVEMRNWLAGHGWFNLHEARVQPPLGYDPHWSRLIDAGLAGLFTIFKFIDPQSAERLMRAWWPCLALALRQMFSWSFSPALRDYGLSLAGGAAVAFLMNVAPSDWRVSHCDAIAINNIAAVICGGLMLALAGLVRHHEKLTRALAIIGAGCASLAVFVLFEPRCVHGPFAMVDPAIWPVWHSYVRELQPLLTVFQINPLTAAGIAAFPTVALVATLALLND